MGRGTQEQRSRRTEDEKWSDHHHQRQLLKHEDREHSKAVTFDPGASYDQEEEAAKEEADRADR